MSAYCAEAYWALPCQGMALATASPLAHWMMSLVVDGSVWRWVATYRAREVQIAVDEGDFDPVVEQPAEVF